jgi:hypothetical protein
MQVTTRSPISLVKASILAAIVSLLAVSFYQDTNVDKELQPTAAGLVPAGSARRGRVLVRLKLQNVDGELVLTPQHRRVQYIRDKEGNWRKIELEPLNEAEFIGPHRPK